MKPLLYVDGYNVIGAWPQAQRENWPLDVCRDRLIHLLEDYAGYSGQEVWLVFDGYRTDRTLRTVDERDGLTVVYTRHGETADHYIERASAELAEKATAEELTKAAALSTALAQVNAAVDMYELTAKQLKLAATTSITIKTEVTDHE